MITSTRKGRQAACKQFSTLRGRQGSFQAPPLDDFFFLFCPGPVFVYVSSQNMRKCGFLRLQIFIWQTPEISIIVMNSPFALNFEKWETAMLTHAVQLNQNQPIQDGSHGEHARTADSCGWMACHSIDCHLGQRRLQSPRTARVVHATRFVSQVYTNCPRDVCTHDGCCLQEDQLSHADIPIFIQTMSLAERCVSSDAQCTLFVHSLGAPGR